MSSDVSDADLLSSVMEIESSWMSSQGLLNLCVWLIRVRQHPIIVFSSIHEKELLDADNGGKSVSAEC
jgi:hypothetical protein